LLEIARSMLLMFRFNFVMRRQLGPKKAGVKKFVLGDLAQHDNRCAGAS
jgi:hypothetical protein